MPATRRLAQLSVHLACSHGSHWRHLYVCSNPRSLQDESAHSYLFKMKPPTVIVPECLKATAEKLFDIHQELDGSKLKHQLIGLDIGEEYDIGKNLIVKAFMTYHVVPSSSEILVALKERYSNRPIDELQIVASEQQKITELHLAKLMPNDPNTKRTDSPTALHRLSSTFAASYNNSRPSTLPYIPRSRRSPLYRVAFSTLGASPFTTGH